MKRPWKQTILLIILFLVAQLIGLLVVGQYINQAGLRHGELSWESLPLGLERPEIEESVSLWYLLVAVGIGTLAILGLIRFKLFSIWKLWYALAVFMTLFISIGAFIASWISLLLAAAGAYLKIWRPTQIIHNLTELFIYGGIAALFVPFLSLKSVSILLVIIAAYDWYAVYKSKHMVKMATAQAEQRLFAGLMLAPNEKVSSKQKSMRTTANKSLGRAAILGGGDIGFPLLFAGVIFKTLAVSIPYWTALLVALIVPIVCAGALLGLMAAAKKGKFYPAMPVLGVGCLVGYLVVRIIASGLGF